MVKTCKPSKEKKQGVAYSYAPILVGLLILGVASVRPARDRDAVFPYEFDVHNMPVIWNWVSGILICTGFNLRINSELVGKKLPDWTVAEKIGEKLLSTHTSVCEIDSTDLPENSATTEEEEKAE